MSVKSFEFRAGSSIGRSTDGEPSLLIGHRACATGPGIVPRWVRLPAALGGQEVSVTGFRESRCANPTCDHVHGVLELDSHIDGRQLAVMECHAHGFLWFKLPDENNTLEK